MEVWLLLAALSLGSAATVPPEPPAPCDRAPPHAQPSDGIYQLGVAGDPDLFVPGELYTVTLQGVDSGKGPTPFVGFVIWAELDQGAQGDPVLVQATSNTPTNHSLGSFQAYDAQAKQRQFCKPAVDNATAHPKTEVQVIWSAPSNASAVCVRLCALAGPSPTSSPPAPAVLARKLCAAPVTLPSFARQPPVVDPCCACDQAKYEVTIEGLWSRNIHPKDFPPDSAQAHFGDVIGATHSVRHRVWQEGRVASLGLRRLADDGTTTALEKELKAVSGYIRTIIKARGISWKKIASRSGTPSTFAVFRVDAKHHLVSLVSKLAPSPDWIVGVSALELCNANCTWSASATLPLYPYDVGTDSGVKYTSHRQPTVPVGPVRALRPDWPRDPGSPFYNATMKPFAKIKFTRLRLYEKTCDAAGVAGRPAEVWSRGSCMVTPWGAWGACSVSCGMGRALRQRQYVSPDKAQADACQVQLTEHRRCHGPRLHCRAPTGQEPDLAESSGPCAVSPWSEWSPCEGCGVRARTRHYLDSRAHKRCHIGFRAKTTLSQAKPCEAGPCHRPAGVSANATNFDWFYVDEPVGLCATSEWGEWSPCSVKCGRGRRVRSRLFARGGDIQAALTKRLLHDWNQRFARIQNVEIKPENVTEADPAMAARVQEHLDRCQNTVTMQEAICDGEDTSCHNGSVAPEVCMLSVSVGYCRRYEDRWFHNATTIRCEPFGYTGCGGNANNFLTEESCMHACGQNISTLAVTSTTETSFIDTSTKKHKLIARSTQSSTDNEVVPSDELILEGVDCELGPWLGWNDCIGDCHYAIKLNYRLVVRPSSGQGKLCQKLVKSRKCKLHHCHPHNNTIEASAHIHHGVV